MQAVFILSLDCEGKWGVADHLGGEYDAQLTNDRLLATYRAISELLREFTISATYATTEAFLLPTRKQRDLPWGEMTELLPYAASAARAIRAGDQGWSAPWIPDLIGEDDELACHGFTHSPWGSLTREQAAFEIELCRAGDGRTFVYPRNQVNHVDLLGKADFKGYRAAPPKRSRVRSLASEINLGSRSQPQISTVSPVEIPGGYFVNWLHGPRRIIPPQVTRIRTKRIIRDAVSTGGVAHFWTHPENIAASPATLANLRSVLSEAARWRDEGRLATITQAEYAARHTA